jgi:hypothetical protein
VGFPPRAGAALGRGGGAAGAEVRAAW